jgi:hypothetical protein
VPTLNWARVSRLSLMLCVHPPDERTSNKYTRTNVQLRDARNLFRLVALHRNLYARHSNTVRIIVVFQNT